MPKISLKIKNRHVVCHDGSQQDMLCYLLDVTPVSVPRFQRPAANTAPMKLGGDTCVASETSRPKLLFVEPKWKLKFSKSRSGG